jgi:uncharacterized protein YukE
MTKSVEIGSSAWAADLQQFRDAISSISSDKEAIQQDFNKLIAALQSLDESWKGPGGLYFSEGIKPLSNAGNQMINVIGDVITRLGITLHNYENAESTNTDNLSHQMPSGGTGSKSSGSKSSSTKPGGSSRSDVNHAVATPGSSSAPKGDTLRTDELLSGSPENNAPKGDTLRTDELLSGSPENTSA